MTVLPSTKNYVNLKEWGAFTGEVDKLGQHVPERYLDDRDSLKGTRLKFLSYRGPACHETGR